MYYELLVGHGRWIRQIASNQPLQMTTQQVIKQINNFNKVNATHPIISRSTYFALKLDLDNDLTS